MTVKAGRIAEITAPYSFLLRDEIFNHPAPGQVLIRVLRVGICATDLAYWQSGPAQGGRPIRLGHEPVGIVAEVGAGVQGIAAGQTVTGRIEPAFADYVYADPRDVVHVPEEVGPVSAIGEPLGCVVDAYRRTPSNVGAITAVVGLGFMGLLMTSLLALSPVAEIWGIGRGRESRTAASVAGATRVFGPEDAHLPRNMTDLVVEATGLQAGLDTASKLAAEHGALCILGYHQDADRLVNMRDWNWKGLTVINGHSRDRYQLALSTAAGLRLVASGRLNIAPLFTHQFQFERINDAFHVLMNKPAGFIKASLMMDVPAE